MADDVEYYELLGLERHATSEEIKKAYRKLAVQYHPDKHQENKEFYEQKFKQLSEAYSILSDDEKRAFYDRYGKEGLKMESGGPNPSEMFSSFFNEKEGDDITEKISLTLEQISTGHQFEHTYTRNVACTTCQATGAKDKQNRVCSKCHGQKKITVMRQMGPMIQQMQMMCDVCKGTGGSAIPRSKQCEQCHGQRTIKETCHVRINVPRGIYPTDPITFPQKGNYSFQHENYGSLVVFIHSKIHSHYQRGVGIQDICQPHPCHLLCEVTVDLMDILCQYPVRIPALLKTESSFFVTPDFDDFKRAMVVLPGKGLYSSKHDVTGDLFIHFTLSRSPLPSEQLEQIRQFYPCRHHERPISTIQIHKYHDKFRRQQQSQQHHQQVPPQCTHQ